MAKKNNKRILINKITQLTVNSKRYSGRGRNNKIIHYGRGGGIKHRYRLIASTHVLFDIPAKLIRIDYDPICKTKIGLFCYKNGFLAYHKLVYGIKLGSYIITSLEDNMLVRLGCTYRIGTLPVGTLINMVPLSLGKKAQYIRSPGCCGKILKHYRLYTVIKLPSGVEKVIYSTSLVTMGKLRGNCLQNYKKAGLRRLLGYLPKVRGVAKNPVDHPNGGRTRGGRVFRDCWGNLAKSRKTGKKEKKTTLQILVLKGEISVIND